MQLEFLSYKLPIKEVRILDCVLKSAMSVMYLFRRGFEVRSEMFNYTNDQWRSQGFHEFL